jgi:hypothetical protein
MNTKKPVRRKKRYSVNFGCVGAIVLLGASLIGGAIALNGWMENSVQAERIEAAHKEAAELAESSKSAEVFAQRRTICRAAVAKMMGQEIGIMKVSGVRGPVVSIFYNRPSDRKLWKVDCELDGNDIGWRYVDATPDSGYGDWKMVGEMGETMSFELNEGSVTIIQNFNGERDSQTYPIAEGA